MEEQQNTFIPSGSILLIVAVALALFAVFVFVGQANAAGPLGDQYSAGELLSPCQESDNDSRWGAAAEAECEQYIIGFVHALEGVGMTGTEICPPIENTADEVRWAFMRWVHASYTERKAMTAEDALLGTLRDLFPCGG